MQKQLFLFLLDFLNSSNNDGAASGLMDRALYF